MLMLGDYQAKYDGSWLQGRQVGTLTCHFSRIVRQVGWQLVGWQIVEKDCQAKFDGSWLDGK